MLLLELLFPLGPRVSNDFRPDFKAWAVLEVRCAKDPFGGGAGGYKRACRPPHPLNSFRKGFSGENRTGGSASEEKGGRGGLCSAGQVGKSGRGLFFDTGVKHTTPKE